MTLSDPDDSIENKGPYDSEQEARWQFDWWKSSLEWFPGGDELAVKLLMQTAVIAARVELSDWERQRLKLLSMSLDPIDAQLLAGLLARAGRERS